MLVSGARAQWTQAACLLVLLPPPLCQPRVMERQPGWVKTLQCQNCGVQWKKGGARKTRTQLQIGHDRVYHCWSDQEPKDRSKVRLEAPTEMEEINTDYYLITNCIVWLQQGFKLRQHRKLHFWYFLYFEDGTMTFYQAFMIWLLWMLVWTTDIKAVWGIWILTVFGIWITQNSDPGDLFGLISS